MASIKEMLLNGQSAKKKQVADAVSGTMQKIQPTPTTSQMRPNMVTPGSPWAGNLNTTLKTSQENNTLQGPALPQQPAQDRKSYSGLGDIIKDLESRRQVDVDALEKKRQRDERLAAIGEGIGSFHTAYSHARGVQPMPGLGGANEKVESRYDKLRARLDKDYSDKLMTHLKAEEARRKAYNDDRQAKHQAAQEKYWDEQAKRWANADEVARQKAAEQERANKAKEEETKRNHDMTEKGKNDRAAASRAAANSRAAKAEAGRNARHNDSENRKDKRAEAARKDKQGTKKNLPGQTKPKTKKKLPK